MPTLSTLAGALSPTLNKSRGDVLITRLSPQDDSPLEVFPFQYYPETYTDSKEVNQQAKEIPGGSLPIYQWVSSGARTITFQAYFSSDMDLAAQGVNSESIVAVIKQAGVQRRNVDLRTVFTWLRTFMLPTYGGLADTGAQIVLAPSKLLLTMPGSGIGRIGGAVGGQVPLPDSMVAIMLQCEINVMAAFPSGLPRLGTVDLSFAQVAQLGGFINFPGVVEGALGGSFDDFPYALEPRRGKGVR